MQSDHDTLECISDLLHRQIAKLLLYAALRVDAVLVQVRRT